MMRVFFMRAPNRNLAHGVVDLVRAGMTEVLALEPPVQPVRAREAIACVSGVGRPTKFFSSASNSPWKRRSPHADSHARVSSSSAGISVSAT